MGGVDLSDIFISLYYTKFKTKRCYLKIMDHCIDICKVNAWLIYRRYFHKRKSLKTNNLAWIASALIRARAVVNQAGRIPKCRSSELDVVRRTLSEPEPIVDIWFDDASHWPEFGAHKRKCRLCKTGRSRVFLQEMQYFFVSEQCHKLFQRISYKIDL